MRLDILAGLLQTAGLGTIGTSIFVHSMPSSCLEGILLRMPLEGVDIDNYLPHYYKHGFQVIVRSRRIEVGEDVAKQVMAALTIYNQTYTDPGDVFAMKINHLYPSKLPIVYPRSDGNAVEWSINFDACYVLGVE